MSVKMIVVEAAEAFGLCYAGITGRARGRTFTKARTAAAIALRRKGFSYPRIGQLLGGRDHSTIIYFCDKCSHWLNEPDFAGLVDRLFEIKTNAALSRPNGRPRKALPAVIEVSAPLALPRLRPPPAPRLLLREGRIDGEQLVELEHRAAMKRGSAMLAQAINSQFRVEIAA